ncbi:alpha/beta fold hydrolase [Actinoplanes sp. N902-109]|uniref:alpha/beta fold hydrolase n=1 Tax=Actinoplanes sp. (strain N902-109) TaxID=649831 RepID=UPI00032938AB|nr:alpha/beta fold hydrolase [Actinoplanes sp. N902-109]AGL15514.1 alpha/beta hydrolase fold containing protein [Actinoplanes sp. N902-109]
MGIEYATNGDVSIAYETFGTGGVPLLLVLGLDYQMVWWPDEFCERLVRAGYHVARYDNRDTGLSTHFPQPADGSPWRALLGRTRPLYTLTDMINDGLAVMAALGWADAHVLGGTSAIAQGLAVTHPTRVRSLTLCMSSPATAGVLRTLRYLKFGIFREFRKLPKATTPEQEIDNLVAIHRAQAAPGSPFPEEWARKVATLSHSRAPRDPRTTQRHIAAGRAVKLPPLSGITAPTLVVSGAEDPMLKPSAGRDLAAQIPGATFVEYPGVGHDWPEQIWDDVIARMPR